MRRVPDSTNQGSLDKHAEGWVPHAERSVFAVAAHHQRYGSTPLFMEEACDRSAKEEADGAPGLLSGPYSSIDMVPAHYSSRAMDPQTTSLAGIASELLIPQVASDRAAAARPFREARIRGDAAVYAARQHALLILEELQMIFDMRSYDLHSVRLMPAARFHDPLTLSAMNREGAAMREKVRMEAHLAQRAKSWSRKSLAVATIPIVRKLRVPGALENQPALTKGDAVLLRRAAPRMGGEASTGWMGVPNEIYGVVLERHQSSVYVQLPTFVEGPPLVFQPTLCFTSKPAGIGGILSTRRHLGTQWPSFYDVSLTSTHLRRIRAMRSRAPRRGWPPAATRGTSAAHRCPDLAGDLALLEMLRTADHALVRVAADGKPPNKRGVEPAYFHARFLYSAESSAIFVMRRALAVVATPAGLKPRFRDLLFPTRELVRASLGRRSVEIASAWQCTTGTFANDWFYEEINAEQKHAVAQIIAGCPAFPFLLFGPAGTGKTMTIVEAVLQLVRQNETRARAAGLERNGSGSVTKSSTIPRPLILVVAPSNAAADVIALRLAKADRESLARRRADGLHRKFFVRVNSVRRSKASVPPQVLKCVATGY